MISLLAKLLRRPSPPPIPTLAEINAALADLDRQKVEIDDAMRAAIDRRRAALLRDDDATADALDAEIDALGREQERAELLEQRLLDQAALIGGSSLTEPTP